MKRIWSLYKRDIKRIASNWVAMTIILGLMVLPSLYAWFNIKACWDPYGNTKGIKVAITNEDEGTQIKDTELNIGNQMVEKLKSNDKIGWVFVSQDDAQEGVKSGKYYASILIPNDFSKKISSILTGDINKPALVYSVNEKINAIAPKITDKGVSSLQEQVNKSFIEASSESVLLVLKTIGTKFEENKPEIDKFAKILTNIDSNMDNFTSSIDGFYNGAVSLQDTIKQMQSTLPTFNELTNKATNISKDGQDFIIKSKDSITKVKGLIGDQLGSMGDFANGIETNIQSAVSNIDKNKSKSLEILNKAKDECYNLTTMISNVQNILSKFNLTDKSKIIDNLISSLDRLKDTVLKLSDTIGTSIDVVNTTGTLSTDKIDSLKSQIKDVQNKLNESTNTYNSSGSSEISSMTDTVFGGLNDTLKLLQGASSVLPTVNNVLSSAFSGTQSGAEGLKAAKEALVNSQKIIHDTATDFKKLTSDEKLDKVFDILKTNAKAESEFLSSPVDIKTNQIYPIPNYGSAMTPFYTVLASWVGCLILVSLLSTHVKECGDFKNIKPYEIYFSRLLTFLTIALSQAIIVTLGDLYVLKIYCVNQLLFVLVGLFTSFVFCIIVYTLTSTFGDVGKAISVILLVLQVAGSGGTFPIEVTPLFFRIIYPLLPFTYSIGAMRETVGGIYAPVFAKDIIILALYLPLSFFLALVLKRKLMKVNQFFEEKMEETGLV